MLVNRTRYVNDKGGKPVAVTSVEDVSLANMTSEEYAGWLAANPEEQAKIDKQTDDARNAGAVQFVYVNGILRGANDATQVAVNGIISQR